MAGELMFIDLRAQSAGGWEAAEATLHDGQHWWPDAAGLAQQLQGRDLLLITHGFNVNRSDGMRALNNWARLADLPANTLCMGVLWPGDSTVLPVLDYPVEGQAAMRSAPVLANFLKRHAGGVTSLTMASHSLGARLLLEASRCLIGSQPLPRRLVLMAGAIENDCLLKEYNDVGRAVASIDVVASHADWVLQAAFPAGNLVGQWLLSGHPHTRQALGIDGPAAPFGGPCSWSWRAPDGWNFGHLDYLPGASIGAALPVPQSQPGPSSPRPNSDSFWKPAWSAAVLSTALKC